MMYPFLVFQWATKNLLHYVAVVFNPFINAYFYFVVRIFSFVKFNVSISRPYLAMLRTIKMAISMAKEYFKFFITAYTNFNYGFHRLNITQEGNYGK
jgi:hypothetical protein